MVVIVGPGGAESVRSYLDERGEAHYDVGRIVAGLRSVSLTKRDA